MKQKLFTLLLAFIAAISFAGAKDLASGSFKNGGTWRINDQGELYVDAVTVPDFSYRKSQQQVLIGMYKLYNYINTVLNGGDGVYYIVPCVESNAPWMAYRSRITSIRLSANVVTIGEAAFAGLGDAKKLTITARSSNNVVIKKYAFHSCSNLTSLELSNVKTIGDEAFACCFEIRTVKLGDGLQQVGSKVFAYSEKLFKEGSYIILPNNNTLASTWHQLVPDRKSELDSETHMVSKNVRFGTAEQWKDYLPMEKYETDYWVTYIAPMSAYGIYTSYAGNQDFKLYYGEPGYWFYSNGFLRIYRDKDYASPSDRPWHSIAGNITVAEINTTTIGKNTFSGCSALHFVNSSGIEAHLDNITKIGENAFYGCQQLKMVDMPRIQEIGSSAFENSGLTNVRFNSIVSNKNHELGFKSIGNNAFKNTPLARVEVFGDCPQTSSTAFQSLTSTQKKIDVPPYYSAQYEQAPWNVFEQVIAVNFPVKFVQNNWSWQLTGDGTLTIQGTANNLFWDNAQSVPWYPYRKYIRRVVVGSGITMIGKNAFCFPNEGESKITSVEIPATVTSIGENAFKNNDELQEVKAEGVQTIASQAFENCSSLEKVKFGKDLSSIGDKAFNYCGLIDAMAVKAATPPAVTAQTFVGLGRMSSNAPAKAKAKYAARKAKNATGQKAVSLDVPDDYIAKYLAAQYWNLFSFEYIGEHGGIVRSGQYYDGVWVIYEDGTLIASSETSTGNIDGFYNDATVKRVELMGGATELTWTGFAATDLPNVEEIVLSPAMHKLGNEVFKGLTKLKSINLENVDSIGQNCFKGCTALKSINLSAVKFIDNNAFEGCSALTEVNITGNGAKLRDFLFKNCTGLKHVELVGLDPTYTPGGAFNGCTALESVKLEGTAMTIGGSMFKDCSALSVVSLGSDCRSVGSKTFANTSLDTIYASSPTPATLSADAFENVTLADIHVRVPADYVRIYKKADIWKDMDILADPAYGEPMLPVGGLMNGGNCQWYLEQDGTMTFSGEGGCYTTGAAIAQHHQYAIYMENIIYTDEITEIGSDITSQYANYAYVKSVEIGADVKRINANAMLYPHVTDVYCFAADVPALNANAFNKAALIANDATLHVVDFAGTLAKYQASSSWNWFPHIVADLPTRKPGTIKVTKVVVDPDTRNIPLTTEELGSKTVQLTADVYPANATNWELKWTSSDESIATVDQNGLVTIVGFDNSYMQDGVTITATAKDGSNKKGSCTMSVWNSGLNPDDIPATGIDVNRKSLTLMKSETGVVRVSLTPANSNALVDGGVITLSETSATLEVMPVYDPESGERTGEFTITPRDLGTFEVTFYTNDYDDHGDPATYPAPSVSMTVNVVEDIFFTENTKEGVPVTYRLIKTDDKLVEVYGDEEQKITVDPNTGIPSVEYINHTAIDPATTGTLTIPSTVRGYNVVGTGEIAFLNCTQLERVDFCPGIQYIGDRAFEGCTSLNEVRLPATLKGLGMNSFAMLTTLKNVHLMAPASPEGLNGMDIWSSSAFMGLWEGENGATLHVAQGCYSVYNVSPWIEWFASIVEDGEAVAQTFSIRFLNWDGEELQTSEVGAGITPVYVGETPVRPEDENYTYMFSGWSPAVKPATDDATYEAQFTATKKIAEGIEEIFTRPDAPAAVKILHNGTLYILRPDGAIYNAAGLRVK